MKKVLLDPVGCSECSAEDRLPADLKSDLASGGLGSLSLRRIKIGRLILGIGIWLPSTVQAQVQAQMLPPPPEQPLPIQTDPIPVLPNPGSEPVPMDFTSGGIPAQPDTNPSELVQPAPEEAIGADLRQLVGIFINESLDAGSQAGAVNFNELYQQVLARSYSNPQPKREIEYEVIAETLERYGDPVDRFLTPEAFREVLSQARTPVESRALTAGVVYFRIPELTPDTPQQIRRALYLEDYSQGILLDLRASSGYDPRVIADVARLFLPRSVTNLVVTEDRFGQLTTWNSPELPIGAGIPLVVLVDGQTRQGAVLLAAQLAASGQVAILGQPTQGTDRQTRFFLLPSGAAVEIAVGRWRTGENRPMVNGLDPMQPVSGSEGDWLNAGLQTLATLPRQVRPAEQRQAAITVSMADRRVGRFDLGLDTRNVDTTILGNVDTIPGASRANVFQPNSDLKIIYIQDFILFNYRNPGIVDSYFADRIYTTQPAAQTTEGIRIGSTYREVTQVYGPPGEGGYNEIVPFPVGSREAAREDRYYVNYDSLGIGFIFEVGSNQVIGIGLYKPGS